MLKVKVIGHALRQRARHQENWYFGRYDRAIKWGHTAKAILCLLLGRRRSLYADLNAYDSIANWNWVDTTSQDWSGKDWDELAVGFGWRDWHYDIYRSGYP